LVPFAVKMASATKIGRGYSVWSDTHCGTLRYLVFHLSEGKVILEGALVFLRSLFLENQEKETQKGKIRHRSVDWRKH